MEPIFSPLPQINRIAALIAGLFLALATAWQAGAQVSLVSAQPPNGATDVPVSASMVFTFSAPIDETSLLVTAQGGFLTGSLVFSANAAATSFSPSWNETFTVLTLSYAGDLPSGAIVSWTINPTTRIFPLMTEDADPVPLTSGSFTTAGGGCDPDGIPDDLGNVSLFKVLTYLQTSTTAPVPKTDELPAFYASVSSPVVNGVTGATLTRPGNVNTVMTPLFGTFFTSAEFNTQAELDAGYPNGSYSFSLSRDSGGPAVFQMQMPAASSYPPIPQVSNFTAAQAVDPALNFTLNFNALTGATGSDYIGLTISDTTTTILSAPDLCVPLPLAKTATSFTIPAGTLEAGKTYTVRLTFARTFYSSTTAPPDFASFGALQRQTVLTIATTGGVVVPQPQVTGAGFQGGFFAFNVGNLVAATTYQMQYSTTLLPGSWQNVQAVTTATPQPIFDLDSNENTGQRFYRVIKP